VTVGGATSLCFKFKAGQQVAVAAAAAAVEASDRASAQRASDDLARARSLGRAAGRVTSDGKNSTVDADSLAFNNVTSHRRVSSNGAAPDGSDGTTCLSPDERRSSARPERRTSMYLPAEPVKVGRMGLLLRHRPSAPVMDVRFPGE
jgi:hypothetical protein